MTETTRASLVASRSDADSWRISDIAHADGCTIVKFVSPDGNHEGEVRGKPGAAGEGSLKWDFRGPYPIPSTKADEFWRYVRWLCDRGFLGPDHPLCRRLGDLPSPPPAPLYRYRGEQFRTGGVTRLSASYGIVDPGTRETVIGQVLEGQARGSFATVTTDMSGFPAIVTHDDGATYGRLLSTTSSAFDARRRLVQSSVLLLDRDKGRWAETVVHRVDARLCDTSSPSPEIPSGFLTIPFPDDAVANLFSRVEDEVLTRIDRGFATAMAVGPVALVAAEANDKKRRKLCSFAKKAGWKGKLLCVLLIAGSIAIDWLIEELFGGDEPTE